MQAKQYICDLTPYQPGLPADQAARQHGIDPLRIIKLASNENPLGPSPLAAQAMQQVTESLHIYPEQFALTNALAKHLQVTSDSLVIGNGSNDVLDIIARVFLGQGDTAIMSQYTFAMYDIAARSAGARTITVPAVQFGHNLTAMQAAITPTTKVIWIANPNNPTGTFLPYDTLEQFVRSIPKHIVVVIDEAYYEYLSPQQQADTAHWPHTYPNVIVVRTFSKIYGLASLRVGYGIAAPKLAELLNRVRLPFTSNGPGILAATSALSDADFVQRSYTINKQGRDQLIKGLADLGLEYLPAHGNFVTVNTSDAAKTYQDLLKQGIITRPLGGYGMPEWLRISVGLTEQNKRLLDALTANH